MIPTKKSVALAVAACLVLGKRQTEIDQHRHPVVSEDNVVWLDVPVNEPGLRPFLPE